MRTVCALDILLVGDFTVDILLNGKTTTTNDARDKIWHSALEKSQRMVVRVTMNVCVRAGMSKGKVWLPDKPPTTSDQLYKLTKDQTQNGV